MDKLLEIFREINTLASVNYTKQQSNHANFLSACHKALANYFKEYFKDEFVFSALSFSKNNELHFVDEHIDKGYFFNKETVSNWEGLKNMLENYIQEVSEDKMISITKLLLDKSNTPIHKDLFFNCSNSDKYQADIIGNNIFEYLLENFNENQTVYCIANRSQLDKFYTAFKNGGNDLVKPLYDRYVWNHHQLAEAYKSSNSKDFILHYVKPSISELDYGLLLSLALNRKLTSSELAYINLVLYRIVSETATEKIKEAERLKTKTMFSLTTHSLKTHLNTTVIKTKNAFYDKLVSYPELKKAFEEHGREVDTLFHLTELLSLIDKVDKPDKFKEAATEVLFSETKVSYKLKEHLEKFNERHKTSLDIEINPVIEIFDFSISIYGLYFGEKLLELFFNTVFENITAYGKPVNRKRLLNIEITNGLWKFTNDTVDESVPLNEQEVKGNLQLFRKLIKETNSGTFSITPKDYKFEIEIKEGQDE